MFCFAVRAHRDPALQRIQHISRMSPRILRDDNGTIKTEFERLMIDNITFVDSWTHSSIGNNVQRMYSKRRPASQAATEYAMGCLRRLVESGDEHLVSTAVDLQRPDGSRADFLPALDPDLLKTINIKSKEPKTLVFWRYATYKATVNGESFSQSQLPWCFMLYCRLHPTFLPLVKYLSSGTPMLTLVQFFSRSSSSVGMLLPNSN